jgi:hypothetical protein
MDDRSGSQVLRPTGHPEIALDGSFLVFCSAGRLPDDKEDHLFIVRRTAEGWGPVVPIRYAEDDTNGYSADDEPHLGPDHRTLYFSSDRTVPAYFPRSHEQPQRDFDHMESWGLLYTNAGHSLGGSETLCSGAGS